MHALYLPQPVVRLTCCVPGNRLRIFAGSFMQWLLAAAFAWGMAGSGQGQTVTMYGSKCVGNNAYFVFIPPSSSYTYTVTSWAMGGSGYTVVSQSASNLTLRWDSPQASFTVYAYYRHTGPYPNTGSAQTTVTGVTNAVTPAVSIATPSLLACQGVAVAFTATPTHGGTSPGYQWQVNGTAVSGATSATLNHTFAAAGSYTVACTMTSNAPGCLTATQATRQVTMTVNSPITAAISPAGTLTIASGGSAALSATAGSGYTYRWYRNGTPVGGATAATHQADQAGAYTVQVTSGGCVAVSAATTVSMLNDYSHVRTQTLLVAGKKTEADLQNLTRAERQQQTTYLDGLGRAMQHVVAQGSPAGPDMVQPLQYDALGREAVQRLAYAAATADGYFKTDAATAQPAFYQAAKGDANAFSETQFEASPLGRAVRQGGTGAAWQLAAGRVSEAAWRTNQPAEVRRWVYDPATGKADGRGFYAHNAGTGELAVQEATDKTGPAPVKVLQYTDYQGRVVCQKVQQTATAPATEADWLTTCYVYDEYGQLRYLLPPSAVRQLGETGKTATPHVLDPATDTELLAKLVFAYAYDSQGRPTEKRVPGAEPTYYVYDRNGRAALTQQGRQREAYTSDGTAHAAGQWNYTKYDALGRPVMTGLYQHGGTATQAAMQALLDAETVCAETRSAAAGHVQGYSNAAFPRTGATPLTVQYYDDYTYPGAHPFVAGGCASTAAYFARVRGLPTGSKVRLLHTDQWLTATPYYDQDGNTIETIADNHLRTAPGSPNGKDMVLNCYDWAGRLLSSELRHQNPQAAGTQARTVRTRHTYDPTGTLTETYQQVDNGTEERIGAYAYNELGELTAKQLGRGPQPGTPLQTVDYAYHIKGWLTGINGGTLNTAQNDKFALSLHYDAPPAGTTGRHDGNLTAQRWVSGFDNARRGYDYRYDAPGRLTGATYTAADAAGTPLPGEDYSLPAVSYDANGNIKTLQRKGIASAAGQPVAYGLVDDLQYKLKQDNEAVEGNRLINVRDLTQATAQTTPGVARDFMEGNMNAATVEYSYDKSGNLISDLNKKVTGIEYNYLGLPSQIVFNSDNSRRIVYRYDGAGARRQRIIYTRDAAGNALPPVVSDYVAGMLYVNNVLQFIPTDEGRWLPPEVLPQAAAQGAYEYHYTDHLGSLRMALRQTADVPAYTATLELVQAQTEEAAFDNVNTTRDGTYFRSGTRASKTNQQKVLGPWRTLTLVKGDKVNAKAYGYYAGTSTTNRTPLQLFLQAYGGGYPVTGEATGNNYPRLLAGVGINIAQPTVTNGVPVAYLKWLFYDKAGNLVPSASGLRQLTSAATTSWESLAMPPGWQAPQDGSLQVFVANESETSVWFDDVEIKYTPDLIAQETHYDPWGLELIGIGEQGSPECRWKFQNKELEDALGLFWQDFGARHYDAQLGRWHSLDPADQFASGYTGMGNNPVNGTDPDGTWFGVDDAVAAGIGAISNVIGNWNRIGSVGDFFAYAGIGAAGGITSLYATPIAGGALTGGLNAAYQGGAVEDIAKGALYGAGSGAVGALGGAVTSGLLQNVYGIVPGALIGAGVQGAIGGSYSAALGGNFWSGFGSGAAFGGISGGMRGYSNAKNSLNQRSIWWGTKKTTDPALMASTNPATPGILRPDDDGYLTLTEANEWYRNGNGKPLNIDASKINFDGVTLDDFPDGIGSEENINLLFKGNVKDGLVHGTVTLKLQSSSKLTINAENYDFDHTTGHFIFQVTKQSTGKPIDCIISRNCLSVANACFRTD